MGSEHEVPKAELNDQPAAADTEFSPVDVLGTRENCFDDHSCKWLRSVSPKYPPITGVAEATCEAWLTVGEDGRAQDISVECDDPRFIRATEMGVSTLQYTVRDSCGKPCRMIGRRIKFPFKYGSED